MGCGVFVCTLSWKTCVSKNLTNSLVRNMTLEKSKPRQKPKSQDKELKSVLDILDAKPVKDETPVTPFKMPRNDKVLYYPNMNPINEDECG